MPALSPSTRAAAALACLGLHGALIYALAAVAAPEPAAPAAVPVQLVLITPPAPKPLAPPKPAEPPKVKPAPPKPAKKPKAPPLLAAARAEPAPAAPRSQSRAAVPPPARPQAPAQAPAPISAARSDLDALHNPAPAYPGLSRRLGEAGTVLLKVRVSAGGAVEDVRLERTSGYARLDEAALRAVRRWRFAPATQAGRPVASWALQPVEFELRR